MVVVSVHASRSRLGKSSAIRTLSMPVGFAGLNYGMSYCCDFVDAMVEILVVAPK